MASRLVGSFSAKKARMASTKRLATSGGISIGLRMDHAAPSSSMKPGGIFGGLMPSLGLHIGQGIRGAPQPQA
jgi:hypothetical protein